jgi:hypothetical protein
LEWQLAKAPKPFLRKAAEGAAPRVKKVIAKVTREIAGELNEKAKRKPLRTPRAKAEAARAKPAAKRKEGQPKRGPLPWKPTKKERELVMHCVAIGMSQEQVALVMEKSVDTLQRHCRRELDAGQLQINAKIGSGLIQKALAGDTTSLIFLSKVRLGFSEKHVIQHTGPEGGPVEVEHMTAKEAAERYRERLG